MPTLAKNNRGNANSPGASNGGSPTTAVPTAGPLGRDTLANALQPSFDRLDVVDHTSRSQPESAARPEPAAEESAKFEELDRQEAGEELPSTRESEAGGEERAAEGEETPGEGTRPTGDEAGAVEDGGAPGEGTRPTGDEAEADENAAADADTPGVQKRIGKLLARIQELEGKVGTGSGRRADGPMPLTDVTDGMELDRRQEQTEAALEETETLIGKLAVAPNRVEQYLRSKGIVLKDEAGNEDFSPERMADALGNAKSAFRQTLRQIPQRRQWLQHYAAAHRQIVQAIPWVADPTDDRHATMSAILEQFPNLRSAPNYEYWVAAAVEGDRMLRSKVQSAKSKAGNGNGPGARGARPAGEQPAGERRAGMPGGASKPGAVVRARPQQQVEQAKNRVLKEGSRRALSAFFEATGAVR